MRRFSVQSFVGMTLLGIGSVLLVTASALGDTELWPASEDGSTQNKYCEQQSASCFTDPGCYGCTHGDVAWRICGNTIRVACKEVQTRTYGKCTGTNSNTITCYGKYYCSRVARYTDESCIHEVENCRFWVYAIGACDPDNP